MKQFLKKVITLGLVLSLCLVVSVAAETIKVGTNAEFPPFESIHDDGSIVGFDADLLDALMKKMGVEYSFESIEFDALPMALEAGQFDLVIAGMTITEEKKQTLVFSDPYFEATQKLIVPEGSPITSASDLKKGMKVGVQQGTTADFYLSGELPDVECVRYSKALDGVMDLKIGRLDAVMVDAAPSEFFAKAVPGLVVLDENLSDEQYGLVAKKGNEALMDKVNVALKEIKEDGQYEAIFAKYFSVTDAK